VICGLPRQGRLPASYQLANGAASGPSQLKPPTAVAIAATTISRRRRRRSDACERIMRWLHLLDWPEPHRSVDRVEASVSHVLSIRDIPRMRDRRPASAKTACSGRADQCGSPSHFQPPLKAAVSRAVAITSTRKATLRYDMTIPPGVARSTYEQEMLIGRERASPDPRPSDVAFRAELARRVARTRMSSLPLRGR
jgi:hypothetical protein